MLCPFASLPHSLPGRFCQSLGFPHFGADVSLINVFSAKLGTYNPGACVTLAACLMAQTCPAPQTCSSPGPSSSSWPHPSRLETSSLKPPVQQQSLLTVSTESVSCVSGSSAAVLFFV